MGSKALPPKDLIIHVVARDVEVLWHSYGQSNSNDHVRLAETQRQPDPCLGGSASAKGSWDKHLGEDDCVWRYYVAQVVFGRGG